MAAGRARGGWKLSVHCINKILNSYCYSQFSMLPTILRQPSRPLYKHATSEISTSTRAQSPEHLTLSPSLNTTLNDSWKRDIMPVCRSANFSTQEGRKYCQFPLLPKHESDAYFKEILSQTLLSESRFSPLKLEEALQRTSAVNQMIKIQKQGHLKPETLHLAVRMADRYLLNEPLKGTQLAVLGCVCLWLASKIQDSITPKFRFWVSCGQRFLEEQLTTMQSKVLQYFGFDLNIPTPLTFFNLLVPQMKIQQRTFYLCHYLMELTLLDSKFLEYPPSVVTLSSVYIAMQITDPLKWNEQRFCQTLAVNSQQLKNCGTLLMTALVEASKMASNYVVEKYSSEKYFKVSKITFRRAIR